MRVRIEKHLFGNLLEDDIKNAINETALKPYALHNLTLRVDNHWRQYDHLIVLPHKMVIIEAKNSTSDYFEVNFDKDIFLFNNQKVDYNTSVVQQITRSSRTLHRLMKHLTQSKPFKIEGVACIRATEVRNTQSIIPVYTDTLLWYYLKSLESELVLFDIEEIKSSFNSVITVLNYYTKTQDEYEEFLVSAGVKINRTMFIDETLLVPKPIEIKTDLNTLATLKSKRDERLTTLSYLLKTHLKKIPLDAYSYALKYPTVSIETIFDYLVEMEPLEEEYPFIKRIMDKNSHLIDGKYILNYCSDNNVFFSEFMSSLIKYYEDKYPIDFRALIENPNYDNIPKVSFSDILYRTKRGF